MQSYVPWTNFQERICKTIITTHIKRNTSTPQLVFLVLMLLLLLHYFIFGVLFSINSFVKPPKCSHIIMLTSYGKWLNTYSTLRYMKHMEVNMFWLQLVITFPCGDLLGINLDISDSEAEEPDQTEWQSALLV